MSVAFGKLLLQSHGWFENLQKILLIALDWSTDKPMAFLSLAFLTTVRQRSVQSSRLQSSTPSVPHARQRAFECLKRASFRRVAIAVSFFLRPFGAFHVRRFLCCFPGAPVFDARTRKRLLKNRLRSRAFRRREHFLHSLCADFSHRPRIA